MPETARTRASRRWLALPGALALLATPLSGIAAPLAVLAGLLLCGLALARGDWKPSLNALARLWAAGLLFAALLLAWPLTAFVRGGSLWSALGISAAGGVVLLAAWRGWPLFARALAGELSDMRDWRRVIQLDPVAWRGLKNAVPVAVLLAGGIAIGWPGLWAMPVRWTLAALMAVIAIVPVLRQRREAAVVSVARAEAETRQLRNADRIELDTLFAPPAADVVVDEEVAADAPASPIPTETRPAEAADVPAAAPSTEASAPVFSPEQIATASAELYAAARAGRVDRALALLESGADPLSPPPAGERDQRGLAQLAAVLPDLRLLRTLIQRGVPLGAEARRLTPLLAATRDSWHGRPEAVMTLLANGADPRARDDEGNTPLHHAARSTDPGVAALLLDAAAEIDTLNDARQSPLAMACLSGNWRLAKFLSERGAKTHPAGGDPVLLAAAATEEDDPAGVQYLLRHKAAVNARGADGSSALHHAAAAGHVAIVQTLLDAGADARQRDDAGLDAWLAAAGSGQQPVLEALLENGADLSAVDAEGRDALMRAMDEGQANAALARWLRERGLDTERVDAQGTSAVQRAVATGRWALVGAIDPNYPLPTVDGADDAAEVARPPMQLLAEALSAGDREAIARSVTLLSADERGRALVEAASLDPARIALLLPHRPALEARGPDGDIAVFALLAKAGQPEARAMLRELLAAGASPAGAAGLARYLAACLAARVLETEGQPLALELLARGADTFAPHASGESPLLLALRLGWLPLARGLLERGADPNQADERGLTPLHVASALGLESIVPLLIRHGAQPAARAGDGQTALGVALASGRRELAGWLDWRGWPHPGRALRASDLASAAILGDADALGRLLHFGFDVDTRDAQGCSALLRAAGGGHEAVVSRLLAAGADAGLAAESGATPLSAAVSMRHLGVVDALLAAGADVEQRLPGDVTVLMLASALGLPDMVSRLLAAGADLHLGDAEGLKPMHCAALFGFATHDRARLLALFDTLHLAGAEADEATVTGLTPLLLLLGARAEPGAACDEDVLVAGLERLLEEGATLPMQDQRGFGPLHLAALHGMGQVVRVLLRHGADPNLRDRLNRTPREIAAMRGFMDVAAEFASDAGTPSMARFLREPGR